MTPEFRNAVFSWTYNNERDGEEANCIPLQLQRLFARLAFGDDRSVDTVDLTRSFGWEGSEVFQQQDVQELTRVLFDALEQTCKGTPLESIIDQIYGGQLIDYIKCIDVDYSSERNDKFLDLSFAIIPFGESKPLHSLPQCIEMFLRPELLDGENQYYAESFGKKVDAIKGLKFGKLPRIMSCNLKRFVYDFSGSYVTQKKLNDQVKFPLVLDMNRYVSRRKRRPSRQTEGLTQSLEKCNIQLSSRNGSAEASNANSPRDESAFEPNEEFEEFLRAQMKLLKQPNSGMSAESNGFHSVESSGASLPDLVDAHGNKAPDQLEEEREATLFKTEWTDEELIQLIRDRGEWVYELFAVLIHSGSSVGSGHYYAYIKNADSQQWLNFNDSSVSPISVEQVTRAWGGPIAAGTYSYGSSYGMSSANAYMLMYRKLSLERLQSTDRPALFPATESLPVHMLEDMRRAEEQRQAKQREQEELRNQIVLRVYWQDKDHHIPTNRFTTYHDFLVTLWSKFELHTYKDFAPVANGSSALDPPSGADDSKLTIPVERMRLRVYYSFNKTSAEAFDYAASKSRTLDALNITPYKTLLLETVPEGEDFEVYYNDGISVTIDELDTASGLFRPKQFRLEARSTCLDLYERVAAHYKVPVESIRLIRCPTVGFEIKGEAIFRSSSTRIKDAGIMEYTKILLDLDCEGPGTVLEPFDPEKSPSFSHHLLKKCQINIKYNAYPSRDLTSELVADNRWTVGELRKQLADLCHLPVEATRMLKANFSGQELINDSLKLHSPGVLTFSTVCVLDARLAPVGSVAIRISRFNPPYRTCTLTIPDEKAYNAPSSSAPMSSLSNGAVVIEAMDVTPLEGEDGVVYADAMPITIIESANIQAYNSSDSMRVDGWDDAELYGEPALSDYGGYKADVVLEQRDAEMGEGADSVSNAGDGGAAVLFTPPDDFAEREVSS